MLVALNKFGSYYLRKEFRQEAQQFLEDITNSVVSTVAAQSTNGQGMSCFCPAIVIGGDDHALLHLPGLLLEAHLEREWVRRSKIESFRNECLSFVQEQRQMERSSTTSRPNGGGVLSFCFTQAGFRAPQHLCKSCIVSNLVCCDAFVCLGCSLLILVIFHVFQLTTLIVRGPVASGEMFFVIIDRVLVAEDEVQGALLCVQNYFKSPHFTQWSFFLGSGIAIVTESAAISDSITISAVCGT